MNQSNKLLLSNLDSQSNWGHKASIGALLFYELLMLTFLGLENYKVSLGLCLGVIAVLFLYKAFTKPVILINILLLSILAGTIGKSGGGEPTVSFVDIIFPILIAIYLIRIFFDPPSNESKNFLLLKASFFLFMMWGIFTITIAVDTKLALGYWRNFFGGFVLFCFALYTIKTGEEIKYFIITLIVWGIILAFIEFFILYTIGGTSAGLMKLFLTKNLLATSWGRSNYLAAFYVLIIPLTMGYMYLATTKSSKIIFSIILVIMFSAVMLTLSRGGILSLLVGVFLLLPRLVKPRTFIPIFLLVVLIGVIVALNPLTFVVFEGLGKVDKSFSYMTRLNFYEDVWKTFLNYPITGIGLGNLGYYAKFKIAGSASAHNLVLGLLGETGIIGTILFLTTLIGVFIKISKNYLRETNEKIKLFTWAFISSFTGVLVHSMMEPNFEGFQFSVMLWSSIAVFLKITDLDESEKLNLIGKSQTTATIN